MKLRVTIYKTAQRMPLVVLNRYFGTQVIGIGLKVGHRRCLSIRWAEPLVPPPLTCRVCGEHIEFDGDKREQANRAVDHWAVHESQGSST